MRQEAYQQYQAIAYTGSSKDTLVDKLDCVEAKDVPSTCLYVKLCCVIGRSEGCAVIVCKVAIANIFLTFIMCGITSSTTATITKN